MADVDIPATPVLARVPNVELIHTGTWDTSTGTFTWSSDDLYSAVAALGCPAVRRPILKLGHTDPRFDGEPAVGYVDNMAVAEDGYTLVGDFAGMPGWLGDVLASAYPDRSIEGEFDFRCQMNHTHPFVVSAVALLGVSAPAIGSLESLQDVATLYGVAATADTSPADGHGTRVAVVASTKENTMPNPRPTKVAASVTAEDVMRAFYKSPLGTSWDIWVEEMQLEPLQLIYIDDSTGARSRVPVTVADGDGEDAVSFSDPIQVHIRYEDAPKDGDKPAAKSLVFASKAESRPDAPPNNPSASTDPETPHPDNPGEEPAVAFSDEQLTTLRQKLGTADDADEATILAALDQALEERADPPKDPPKDPENPDPPETPEGMTVIETDVLEDLKVAASQGREARKQQLSEARDRAVDDAVKAGKITPARRDHWVKAWDADSEGTSKILASLEPGLVPTEFAGTPGTPDQSADDAVYESLFGKQTQEA